MKAIQEKKLYWNNVRTNIASSRDSFIPSEPLSKEYNMVDDIETHAPSLRCQSVTTSVPITCIRRIYFMNLDFIVKV